MYEPVEFVSKTFKSGIDKVSDYAPYNGWWDHIDWVSNNYNYQKNKILLEQTTISAGARYHNLIINRQDTKSPTTYIQSGIFTQLTAESHTAVANYFLRKINNQPSLFQELQS